MKNRDAIRKEYIKRINNTIDFIDKNLEKDLSLDHLSSKAFFSSFHFHRIFSAIVGETINAYITRKRIERIASILLVGTDESLTELAYKYGFGSGNSFSRTFKKFYGISPSEFKINGKDKLSKIGVETMTIEKYICSMSNIKKWMEMNAQIEVKELPEIKLAGIMHVGDFDKIGDTYQKLLKWAASKEIVDPHNLKTVTIYHDNPRVTKSSKVRQSACLIIENDAKVEGEVRHILIEKGYFAIGHFEIAAEEFQKAWDSICFWVIENVCKFRDGDYFELYHNDYRLHPEHKFIVDICIPIENENIENHYNDSCIRSVYPKGTEKSLSDYLKTYKAQIEIGDIRKAYRGLMNYIMELRIHFINEYPDDFIVGSIYQGYMDITYFPFTPTSLKQLKLKIAIVFNHVKMRFEVWLAGQNRQVQKKYWEIFKDSDWNRYHRPSTVNEGFSIIDDSLVEKPDFSDTEVLTKQIESRTMKFIQDITDVLNF